jgi:hypothetical protein
MKTELSAFEAGVAQLHRIPAADAEAIGHPRRPPAALDAAILEQLAGGPLMKWQLREALHEPESYLLKRLTSLKAAGRIKVVGKMLDKRAWALATWSAPMPPGQRMSLGRPPAPKPSTSWWIGASREEFAASVKERHAVATSASVTSPQRGS